MSLFDLIPAAMPGRRPPPKSAVASHTKLRGGYYTPMPIARQLCGWAVRSASDRVLEPSAGDGNFVVAAAESLRSRGASIASIPNRITAVELDPVESQKVGDRLSVLLEQDASACVACGDFFAWHGRESGRRFDAVVGNPPFIRYQNFPEPSRGRAMGIMARLGLRPNRLTNIWVPFVVAAVDGLAVGGRLALVLPAELLQVSYAAQLRSFLIDHFKSIDVLACNHMIFDGAEQEVVVLLADGRTEHPSDQNECAIDVRETQTVDALLSAVSRPSDRAAPGKVVRHGSEKWLKYFLTADQITLMRRLREADAVVPLLTHASVDVGIVTGDNAFFVVTEADARAHGILEYCVPIVGRSAQLRGATLDRAEWAGLAAGGHRNHLFAVPRDALHALSPAAAAYVRSGERRSAHAGYKCSIRTPWYAVPAVWPPDCFLFRQIYDFPRAVLNRAGATSTDTIHRLTVKAGDPAVLAANLYTHLTAASSEIEGRSYGGGVLELEPTEAERLLVPRFLQDAMPLAEADPLIRSGRTAEVLAENDRRVLVDGLGLSTGECAMLRDIWDRMRDRRRSRRRRPAAVPG